MSKEAEFERALAWVQKIYPEFNDPAILSDIIVDDLDIEEDDTWVEIVRELRNQIDLSKYDFLTPGCCQEVISNNTVFLDVKGLYDDTQSNTPFWAVKASKNEMDIVVSVDFCPHCGKKTPGIEPSHTDKPVCSFSDGGYYCDVCKERLHACICLPYFYKWRVKQ